MRRDAQPPTSGIYRPRNPRASPLYQCIRQHGDELDAAGLAQRMLAWRHSGYYSNRSRGARRLVENGNDTAESIGIDGPPADNRCKASWARLIQKVYEVDPLTCTRCGATMRIIALVDDNDVIERILRHLNVWDPMPETLSSTGPDPPLPKGETLPLTYHPLPDIA